MAERRMFSKKITDSDAFIELSSAAQALYFHLNQAADDDGFNNQIQMAMYKAHASTDDLKILLAKNFIIRFESGVIVIKHWRMHNTLRKDRHNPTNFQEELSSLGIKENGAYTLNNNGCQVVAKRLPQYSIGKYSIGKDSIGKDSIEEQTSKTDSEKIKYRDFVKMKETEYQKLIEKFGDKFTERCLDVLDNYKGSKGKTYKDDYRAILNWVTKRVEEEGYKPKPTNNGKEMTIDYKVFSEEEYSKIIKGVMKKDEILRIAKERNGVQYV